MSGGKGSNTTTTQTGPPAWLQSAYMGTLNRAQDVSNTPYAPYTGELVAGVNPQEQSGIDQANQYSTWAQPYLDAAANYTRGAAAPITQQQIQQYQNPEAAAVSKATLANFADLNAQQNQQVIGNAISSGAWGGDRASVAQAELARQQAGAEAPVLAGINQASYNTGLQTALTEQQQQAQAAYSMGNIGQAAQSMGLQGAGARIQGGQLQQGTQQALDQAQMQQYYTAMGYPFQTASWLAGIEGGIGGLSGGTSSTTGPAPNPLNAILGIGATAAGAYMGAGHAGGGRIPGIHIPHFDSGGAAGPMPYSGGISFIPDIPMTAHGRGPPPPPRIDGGQQQQGGGSGGLGNIGSAAGKYFGSPGGISTSGAGAGFPLEGSADAAGLMTDASVAGGAASETAASAAAGLAPEMAAAGIDAGATAAAGFSMADLLPLLLLAARGGRIPAHGMRHATGGGVGLEDVGRGFAGDDAGIDDPDSPYNRGLLPRPTVGYSGGDIDASDINLNGGRGGLGLNAPYEATNPAIQADAGVRSGPARAYAPPAGISAASALNPSGGTGSSINTPSASATDGRSTWEKMSLPLMQAGFAMMASRSPFLGEAIGQGGLAGINAYVGQEHEARSVREKDQEIALRAKQLSDQAEQHAAALKQTTANQQQQRELEEKKLAQPKTVPIGGTLVDPNTGKPLYSSPGSALSPDAAQILGRRLAGGDMTALSGLPQGTAGAAARAQVQNIAADVLTNEKGLKPEEAAALVTARSQEVHAAGIGQSAQQRSLGTMEARMGTAAFEASGAIKLARGAIERVPRTSFLPFNKLIQGFQNQTLNPDQAELFTRTQGVINAYAAVMGRGASVTTDASRHRAEELLQTATDAPVFNRVLDTMESEIGMAIKAPEQMRQFYAKKYGKEAVGVDAGATPAPTAVPAASTLPPGIPPPEKREAGKTYTWPAGPRVWTGTGWQQPAVP